MITPPDTDWDAENVRQQALAALGDVWDPELGLDVVALGLIYDVRIDGSTVDIDMTLTTPGCPVSEQLPIEAGDAVRQALPQHEVNINVVWDPPWTPERLSPSPSNNWASEYRIGSDRSDGTLPTWSWCWSDMVNLGGSSMGRTGTIPN